MDSRASTGSAFVDIAHRIVVPPWSAGPTAPEFAALRLDPWRLRVQPAQVMAGDPSASLLRWAAEP